LKSLKKALDIIDMIAESGTSGVRDLSALTGYPSTTVHRIITTLTKHGYLRQNPESKGYSLSTRFLEFADCVQQQFDLVAIAKPYLERVERDTGESVNLGMMDNFMLVYLDHIHSRNHSLQAFTRLGARVPLYSTGMGKVFLSFVDPEKLDAFFKSVKMERYTEKTITDKKSLLKELARIREQGFAIDDEEKERGVRCVAAPVFDRKGIIVAAVSISGAVQWISQEKIEPLSRRIILCASEISAELGRRPVKTK
jgi:DNA-binding IclR family transcriptional regulator